MSGWVLHHPGVWVAGVSAGGCPPSLPHRSFSPRLWCVAWFAEAHEVVEVVGSAEGLGADVVDVGGGATTSLAGVVVAGECGAT